MISWLGWLLFFVSSGGAGAFCIIFYFIYWENAPPSLQKQNARRPEPGRGGGNPNNTFALFLRHLEWRARPRSIPVGHSFYPHRCVGVDSGFQVRAGGRGRFALFFILFTGKRPFPVSKNKKLRRRRPTGGGNPNQLITEERPKSVSPARARGPGGVIVV